MSQEMKTLLQDGVVEPVEVPSEKILAGSREIIILHKGERYRLRVTQSDKLILTK